MHNSMMKKITMHAIRKTNTMIPNVLVIISWSAFVSGAGGAGRPLLTIMEMRTISSDSRVVPEGVMAWSNLRTCVGGTEGGATILLTSTTPNEKDVLERVGMPKKRATSSRMRSLCIIAISGVVSMKICMRELALEYAT